MSAARRFMLDAVVKPVHGGRERRPAEEQPGRLVRVGKRRAGHARHHGQPAIGWGQGREGAHRGQAGQPIGYGHEQEPAVAAPFTPVRQRVEDKV